MNPQSHPRGHLSRLPPGTRLVGLSGTEESWAGCGRAHTYPSDLLFLLSLIASVGPVAALGGGGVQKVFFISHPLFLPSRIYLLKVVIMKHF